MSEGAEIFFGCKINIDYDVFINFFSKENLYDNFNDNFKIKISSNKDIYFVLINLNHIYEECSIIDLDKLIFNSQYIKTTWYDRTIEVYNNLNKLENMFKYFGVVHTIDKPQLVHFFTSDKTITITKYM